jgi:hypothetical protein
MELERELDDGFEKRKNLPSSCLPVNQWCPMLKFLLLWGHY